MKPEHIALWKAIDKILWEEWDPIGVGMLDNWAEDEYRGYLPQIFQMKINNCTKEDIARELDKYVTNNMGMNGNLSHCRTVADKIIALN